MAARIAHYCPGYGNPWNLTLGQWFRIIERIPDLRAEDSELTAVSVAEGVSNEENTMRLAKKIARKNERDARRLQNLSAHRSRSKSAR